MAERLHGEPFDGQTDKAGVQEFQLLSSRLCDLTQPKESPSCPSCPSVLPRRSSTTESVKFGQLRWLQISRGHLCPISSSGRAALQRIHLHFPPKSTRSDSESNRT
ncbi:uncharacterized protein LOC144198915 [Stigmatopora nigra]